MNDATTQETRVSEKMLDDAAKAAAKVLFGDTVEPKQTSRFIGTLDFDVTFKRSAIPDPRTNPQKARPWSLVQVLLSKLAEHVGDAALETWLETGVREAQMLDTDDEGEAQARMERLIEKLLPLVTEQASARLNCKSAVGTLHVEEDEAKAA